MEKVCVTISMEEERLKALEFALKKKNSSVQRRMDDALRQLYEKEVPEPIREYVDSYTNQLFVILTEEQAEVLGKEYPFEHQQDLADGSKVVRFCTSWATTEAEKDQLIRDIRAL